MKTDLLSKILTVTGGIAMAVGAIDPLEGSALILPGSGLLALGMWLGQADRRAIQYRMAAFVLLAIAVAAVWGFTFVGGTRSALGVSLIVVPYLIGWNLGIWGPGSPRWLLWLGAGVGALFLVAAVCFAFQHTGIAPIFAVFGILPLTGCIVRLNQRKNSTTAAA